MNVQKQFSERSPLFKMVVDIHAKFSHTANQLDEETRAWFAARAGERFAAEMLYRLGWDMVHLTTSLCELDIIDNVLGVLCGCLESEDPDRNIQRAAKVLADGFERDFLLKAASCVGSSSSMSSNIVDQCKVQAYAKHAESSCGLALSFKSRLFADLRRLEKGDAQ